MGAQSLQVDGQGDTGLVDVCGGLLQGQRQVTQFRGYRCSIAVVCVVASGASGEQLDCWTGI
jgi:hypothetical protein